MSSMAPSEDDGEWEVDTSLEKTLELEAEKMRSEMKAAGLKIMTERKSDQELAEERITLKESEVNVQNAELNAKNHVFVTDGRIKDKRDMIGKGSETLFDFEVGDTSSSDYRKEGNIEFYTRANLHKRKAISRDRVVKKWLSIFWNTFSSVQSTGRVHHAEYVQVHMSIGKALFDPEEWDEEEVRETVELDWVRENGTSDTMDQAKFARSLFELVDTWAATIRLVEYRMFLQKLYFRITGSSTDAAMRERHAQRLRELERQQCKLRLSMKKYVERINSLTALAREIALKAKKVRDEKIKAINAAKQCELEEKECKERTAILECIRMEKDATKRAQLVSEARRRYSDDESFADAASHDEIGIGTLIAAEQEKLAATEAKRQRIEATHRKLSEVEATFIQREKELLEERSSCEDQMKSAEERMKAIEKESNEISNLAMGRRTWAPLDQIMSLRGHSEASMLSAMRKDRDFASFCQDNRLELQENIPSPDDIEVDLRRFSYLDDDDDDDDSEGLDDIDVYDMRLQKVTRQREDWDDEEEVPLVVTEKHHAGKAPGKSARVSDRNLATSDVAELRESVEDDEPQLPTTRTFSKHTKVQITKPPADFTTWLESRQWNAWRDMCRGVSPPLDVLSVPARLRTLNVDAAPDPVAKVTSPQSPPGLTPTRRRLRQDLPPITRQQLTPTGHSGGSRSPQGAAGTNQLSREGILESRSHPTLQRRLPPVTSPKSGTTSDAKYILFRPNTAPNLQIASHRQ